MKAKKFSLILFIIIFMIAIGIGVVCKIVDTKNVETTATTYETEVYQAYLEIQTTKPKSNKDKPKDKTTTKKETTKHETTKGKQTTTKPTVTTTKPTTTTKPKETTTKKLTTQTKPQSNQLNGSLDFGSDDALMLHKIAVAEAGGESVESIALVMLVVLNRVYDNRFPDSIYGVIHQKNQFTPVASGSYAKAQPNDKSQKAMELVINGWNESQGALYFESCSGSSWQSRNLTYLFEKDGHRYYK